MCTFTTQEATDQTFLKGGGDTRGLNKNEIAVGMTNIPVKLTS